MHPANASEDITRIPGPTDSKRTEDLSRTATPPRFPRFLPSLPFPRQVSKMPAQACREDAGVSRPQRGMEHAGVSPGCFKSHSNVYKCLPIIHVDKNINTKKSSDKENGRWRARHNSAILTLQQYSLFTW
ncbi:hypothetical protein QQF64_013668 [Cirrhinus molitorella]|uniref:Uncharacterized protein n=1 Tax=Cirrhinus molitorella TaxID=172907 RepID=A0ABR3LRT3_9TELE